jgi:hypothetical protein
MITFWSRGVNTRIGKYPTVPPSLSGAGGGNIGNIGLCNFFGWGEQGENVKELGRTGKMKVNLELKSKKN